MYVQGGQDWMLSKHFVINIFYIPMAKNCINWFKDIWDILVWCESISLKAQTQIYIFSLNQNLNWKSKIIENQISSLADFVLWKRLYAGTVPANKEYAAGTVPANKKYAAGTPKKFKFKNNSPKPSKPPLVRPQKCQSFVQKLRGTSCL